MKRIFTGILTLCITAMGSSGIYGATTANKASVMNTYSYLSTATKPATPSTVLTKFYNSANQLEVEINSFSKNVYSYNALGQISTKKTYSWNSTSKMWDISTKTTYEYDTQGQLTRENSFNTSADTLSTYRVFSDYTNGVYANVKTMNYNGTKVTYWNSYKNAFDNGVLTAAVRYSRTSETVATTLDSTVYTYTNGKKTAATNYIYNGSKFVGNTTGTWVETFDYNSNGDLKTDILTSVTRYGNYVSYYEYLFSDYDAAYAPGNLTVSAKTGSTPNLVTLNWTAAASSAVTGYRVVCDTIVSGVINGTSYSTTTQGQNGTHQYFVIPVVGADYKNISNRVDFSMKDAGVLAAANVRVTTISDKKEADGSYDVTVNWDAPQTTSTITKYRVYYSTYSYVETTSTSAVVNVPSYYAEGTNSDGDTYGLPVNIYVVAMYTTGTADKSNIVVCNLFNKTISDVKNTFAPATTVYNNPVTKTLNFSETVSATLYNVNGMEVKKLTNAAILPVSDVAAGVYIIKMVNKDGLSSNTKCVIR